MIITKRLLAIIAIVAALCSAAPDAAAQRGEKTFGVKAGFVTYNSSPSAGIFFKYRFSSHFALAPNVDYVFRHQGYDAFLFNIDTHFPFTLGNPKFEGFPIVGLSYTSWAFHHGDAHLEDDATDRANRFGINIGLGFNYRVTPSLHINVQARYDGASHRHTGIFTAGISYCF